MFLKEKSPDIKVVLADPQVCTIYTTHIDITLCSREVFYIIGLHMENWKEVLEHPLPKVSYNIKFLQKIPLWFSLYQWKLLTLLFNYYFFHRGFD